MTYFIIIIAFVILICFLFLSDKKDAIQNNIQRGGLKTRFPNFVEYCTTTLMTSNPGLEFVKDDGEFLEYRYPLSVTNNKIGYFYIGLQNKFGTYLYTYAISPNGNKIEGYLKEIHNGRNNNLPEDISLLQYEFNFDELIFKMEKINDFVLKFTDQK